MILGLQDVLRDLGRVVWAVFRWISSWLSDVGGWIHHLMPLGSWGEWVSGIGAFAAVAVALWAQHENHKREDDRIKVLEDRERDHRHREAVRDFKTDFKIAFDVTAAPDGTKTVAVKVRTRGADPYAIRSMRLYGPNPTNPAGQTVPMPMDLVWRIVERNVLPEWTTVATREGFPPQTTKNSFNYEIEVEDFNEFWISRGVTMRYKPLRYGRHYPGRNFEDRFASE